MNKKIMKLFKRYLFLAILSELNGYWIICLSDCQFNPNQYFSNHVHKVSTVKAIRSYNISLFSNFNQFSDLLSDCNQNYETSDIVEFLPSKPILIDGSFKIEKVLNVSQILEIHTFTLVNIKGVDIQKNAFFHQSQIKIYDITLNLHFSNLEIYQSGSAVSESECSLNVYNNSDSFLKPFLFIYFNKVMYPEKLCPLIFRSSFVAELHFADINNAFLIKNQLQFSDINHDNIKTLDIGVNMLYALGFDFYNENLTSTILNKYLFKNISNLKIYGVLLGIENKLFENFAILKNIDIVISNFEEFFNGDTSWMKYLNYQVKVDLSNSSEIAANIDKMFRLRFRYEREFVSFDSIYEYPSEDLCLFKNFPHQNLVYPILIPGKVIECSCTLKWLKLYRNLYSDIKDTSDYDINYDENLLNKPYYEYKFCLETFDWLKCNISQRLNDCKLQNTKKEARIFRFDNDNNVYYFLKWLQLILLVILQPILGAIGQINNILVIMTILNKKHRHDFKDPMYSHILINATFNIIYCSVLMLNLVNTCLSFRSTIFCSTIFQEDSTQLFKIIVIHFLGNVFRMCSNLSYLFFSFRRLVLVSMYKESSIFNRMTQINLKLYTFLIITFCSILSLFRIFQYDINFDRNPRKDFPFETRDEFFCQNKLNAIQCIFFNSFKILNRFLNDILSVILNVIIDFCLFKNFNLHLKEKVALTRRNIYLDLDFHKDIKKKKKNLNRMILLNGFIYILSHIPEFLSSILLIVFSKKISHFCFVRLSCDLVNEEMAIFSLISIVTQFYIFLMFDKNFRKSFIEIKARLFSINKHTLEKTASLSVNVPAHRFKNLGSLFGNGLIE
jgi:hypothetical protein